MASTRDPRNWRRWLLWHLRLLKAGRGHRRRRWEAISLLPKHGVGAEVGVWKGDFTVRLLRGAEPRRLYLVDPWRHVDQEGAMYSMDQDELDRIHDGVVRRFESRIALGQVLVLRHASPGAALELPALDWAYIDGDHTYEGARADLGAFWSLIREGGFLAGDDYGVKGWWNHGVTRAVDEFCSAQACESTIIGSQFLIRKPVAAEAI
jgi:hypothetical protein